MILTMMMSPIVVVRKGCIVIDWAGVETWWFAGLWDARFSASVALVEVSTDVEGEDSSDPTRKNSVVTSAMARKRCRETMEVRLLVV
jgi:hypothetical protein